MLPRSIQIVLHVRVHTHKFFKRHAAFRFRSRFHLLVRYLYALLLTAYRADCFTLARQFQSPFGKCEVCVYGRFQFPFRAVEHILAYSFNVLSALRFGHKFDCLVISIHERKVPHLTVEIFRLFAAHFDLFIFFQQVHDIAPKEVFPIVLWLGYGFACEHIQTNIPHQPSRRSVVRLSN